MGEALASRGDDGTFIPFGQYMEHLGTPETGREVATLMLSLAEKLAAAGADFIICPDNTIHQAF